MKSLNLLARAATMAAALALGLVANGAQAQTTLRVAMTASDIPDVTGQPDQGFEGYRFVGYSLYDSLILWDLSKPNEEASITARVKVVVASFMQPTAVYRYSPSAS